MPQPNSNPRLINPKIRNVSLKIYSNKNQFSKKSNLFSLIINMKLVYRFFKISKPASMHTSIVLLIVGSLIKKVFAFVVMTVGLLMLG